MLQHPLDVEVGEVVERDGFVFCDVLPAGAATNGESAAGTGTLKLAAAQEANGEGQQQQGGSAQQSTCEALLAKVHAAKDASKEAQQAATGTS